MRLQIDADEPELHKPPNNSFYQLPYLYSNWLSLPKKLLMEPVRRVIGKVRQLFGVKALALIGLAYVTEHVDVLQWIPVSSALSALTALSIQYGKYLLIVHYTKRALSVVFGWHQPALVHIKIKWRTK
jgi:hypothetical protein